MTDREVGIAPTSESAADKASPPPEQIREQLERLLASEAFQRASSLGDFLRFITEKAIEGREDEVKESTIGVEVFHRRTDFDGRTDNVVRVQAHRLRRRLLEYYSGEGTNDTILIEIPKGHYIPHFSIRPTKKSTSREKSGSGNSIPEVSKPAPLAPQTGSARKRWAFVPVPVALGLALAGAVLGYFTHSLFPPPFGVAEREASGEMDRFLSAIWEPFYTAPSPPLVAFTNPVFLTTEAGDLLRYTGPQSGATGSYVSVGPELEPFVNSDLLPMAGPLSYNGNHTGVGEVEAVYNLTRLFQSVGARLEIRPSRLVGLDDLKQNNVIFLGSPWGNEMLEYLGDRHQFRFGDQGIVNEHPRPGEQDVYSAVRNEETGVRESEHALISVLPGLTPATKIVILAGIWTEGTLAAAQFATSVEGARKLTQYFGGELPQHFQAVLRIEIVRDRISRTTLVTGRNLTPDDP